MNNLSKWLSALLSTAVISSASFAGSDEFKAFPIFTDDNWKPNIEVAAVVGYMNFDRSSINNRAVDDGVVYGLALEFSFDCPVFTLPGDNLLRQQLNINRYDKNGLKVTTIEMNPYYFIDLSKDLVLGFGPGIGAVHGEPEGGKDQWLFAVQAGAGLKYYIDDFLIGADVRYQWTAAKDFGASTKEDLDNMRMLMKVGYRF